MSQRSFASRFASNLLDLAAYFIIPAVGFPLLYELFQDRAPTRWIISGLLVAFTMVTVLRGVYFSQRRWKNHSYTSLQILLIVAMMALPPHPIVVLVFFFVLSAESIMMYSGREAAAWIGVFSLITLAAYGLLFGPSALLAAPTYIAGYIFFGIFARFTAQAEQARAESDRLLQELQTAHRQLQDYASQAEELAVQQERNRLAREMHDTLGHRLTVSSVQLQAAQRLIPSAPDRAGDMVVSALEEVREGLRELRRAVATLRASVEEDLALEPALKRLVTTFQQATGLAVTLSLPDNPLELRPGQRLALLRAAQEGLTNVQKHAAASIVSITLEQSEAGVSLAVQDNGSGVSTNGHAPGFGLHGLRERAGLLGGKVTLRTQATGGSELLVTLPSKEPYA